VLSASTGFDIDEAEFELGFEVLLSRLDEPRSGPTAAARPGSRSSRA
jgi:hypothetical protein